MFDATTETVLNKSSFGSITLFYEHLSFGLTSTLCNLFIILVLLKNIQLLKRSAFVVGLAFSDMVNGLSLLISALIRIRRISDSTLDSFVNPSFCIKQFTPIVLLGSQIPGVLFFFIGIERFLAVCFYSWYRTQWKTKSAWLLTLGAYIFSFVSLAIAFAATYSQPDDITISTLCATPNVVGKAYSIYHYSIPVFGGITAVTTSLIAMLRFYFRRSRLQNSNTDTTTSTAIATTMKNYRKQIYLSRTLFSLAFLDFGFIVVPSLIAILSIFKRDNIETNSDIFYVQILICCRGISNVFIYFIINREFRFATYRFCRLNNSNSVDVFMEN